MRRGCIGKCIACGSINCTILKHFIMFLVLKNLVYFIDFWKISEQGSEMCTGHGKSEKATLFLDIEISAKCGYLHLREK